MYLRKDGEILTYEKLATQKQDSRLPAEEHTEVKKQDKQYLHAISFFALTTTPRRQIQL